MKGRKVHSTQMEEGKEGETKINGVQEKRREGLVGRRKGGIVNGREKE